MKNAKYWINKATQYVSIQHATGNPYYVIDESKLVASGYQILRLNESELMPEMNVVESYYNPLMKEITYVVHQDNFEYKVVYESWDYESAVRFAKKYAEKNGLKYS